MNFINIKAKIVKEFEKVDYRDIRYLGVVVQEVRGKEIFHNVGIKSIELYEIQQECSDFNLSNFKVGDRVFVTGSFEYSTSEEKEAKKKIGFYPELYIKVSYIQHIDNLNQQEEEIYDECVPF